MAQPGGGSFLGLQPLTDDVGHPLDIQPQPNLQGGSAYVSLDGALPSEALPATGVEAPLLSLLEASSMDAMEFSQPPYHHHRQQQQQVVLPTTHLTGRRTSSSAASDLRVASPELSFGTGWLHQRPAPLLPTSSNSQQLMSRSSSSSRGMLERVSSGTAAGGVGGGSSGALNQPLLPTSHSNSSLASIPSSSGSGSLDHPLLKSASHKQQQQPQHQGWWRRSYALRVLLVVAMLVCSTAYLGLYHSLDADHHRQQVHGFYTVTLQPLPQAAPGGQPTAAAAGTPEGAPAGGRNSQQQQVAVTLTGAVEATPLAASNDLPAAVAATVAAAAAAGDRKGEGLQVVRQHAAMTNKHSQTGLTGGGRPLQLEATTTAAAAAEQALGGVFDTDDADIQVYTLWGNLGNVTGVTLHIWMRFLCSDEVALVRGFAVAEQAGEATPFYLDHPKLSDGISNALPQVQLQLSNGSWVSMQQTHQPFKDGSYLNVMHFEGALPPDAHPHTVGVEGWEHMADVRHHRGHCDTPQQAAQKLPWRRPGSVWTVVSPGAPLSPDLHAYLINQHLKHHRQLGLAGLVVVVDSWEVAAALLGRCQGIRAAVEEGALHFWVWAGLRYQGKVYYPQTHIYNAALLAAWGAGVRLLVNDLDEWLVLPGDATLEQALGPGGCLAGTAQARIHRYDHIHPDWHAADAGEAALWQAQPYPQCHQHLFDYRDIGPMPDSIPWKALINPDQIACFHTHHGLVLDDAWPAAHSSLLQPHLGDATGADREVAGRECAFFMHFVNLFWVRRHLEDVPQEEQRRPWPHLAWLVNTCVEESKRDVDWAVAAQQQVRLRKLEGVVEPREES